jgi:hypothetical protein
VQGGSLERLALLEQELLQQYGAAGLAAAAGTHHGSLLALLADDPQLAEQLAGAEQQQGAGGPLAAGGSGAAAVGWQVSEPELLAAVRCCLQAHQAQAGGGGGGGMPPWEDAAALEAAARALCLHYGVARPEQLGYGSLERLARSCLEAAEQGVRAAVQPAAALACGHQQQQEQAQQQQQPAKVQQLALAALGAAPELCSLGGWCGWLGVFQQACGPLPAFLHQREPQLRAAGLAFLQLPGGDAVRVPSQASPEGFVAAASCGARGAAGAAAQVLGLVAAHGSVGAAPLRQLGQLMEGCLAAVVAEAQHRWGSSVERNRLVALPCPARCKELCCQQQLTGAFVSTLHAHQPLCPFALPFCSNDATPQASTGEQGLAEAAQMLLDMAQMLPDPLLPALAEPLLLAPLTALLDGSHAAMHRLLVRQAQAQAEGPGGGGAAGGGRLRHLLQLHKLGQALGVEAWQEPVRRLMLATGAAVATGGEEAEADAAGGGAAAAQEGRGSAGGQGACAGAGAVEELLRVILGGEDMAAAPAHQLGQPGEQQEAHAQGGPAPGTQQQQQKAQVAPSSSVQGQAAVGATSGDGDAVASKPADAAAEAEAEAAAAGPTPQQQVIESIRQGEFGLGLDLCSEAGELASRQNKRIGRALQRLSHDLYSKDTHFVLELIQVRSPQPAGVAAGCAAAPAPAASCVLPPSGPASGWVLPLASP